jgi:exportin-T
MANLFVLCFEHEYPAQWSTFFTDVIELFDLGEAIVDMYIRILDTIDEMIVDRDMATTDQQLALGGQIKDAMREHSMPTLAETWLHVLTAYDANNDVIVSSLLETIAKYISWIDIRFALEPRFLHILFRFMTNVTQREHACQCLIAMVEKGMDPAAKLDLVRSLNLLTLIGEIGQNVVDDEAFEFQFRLSQLVNAIGTEIIEALSK